MKPATTSDTLRWNVARLAANDWFRQACRNPYTPFFLYWRKAKAGEKMALPIVATDAPNEEYTRDIQISNAWSTDIATRKIAEAMYTLPILGS